MKIAIVVGTRPEIIKMAPVIKLFQEKGAEFFLVHSNQHYSKNLDQVFMDFFNLPPPKYNLNIGSGSHSNQIGSILIKLEPILMEEKPDLLVVQGDTNTVFSAAFCASKLNIKIAHVEAGLRSYNRSMPEETNRVMVDHLSDYLFAVTSRQKQILLNEGISSEKIHVVGNTVIDALLFAKKHAPCSTEVLSSLKTDIDKYFLVTLHRASNVDSNAHLKEIVQVLINIQKKYGKQLIWPIHPRTQKHFTETGIVLPPKIHLIEPQDYPRFVSLMRDAEVILTDSGGIQEEACALGVPCVTLREDTERPESLDVKANFLTGRDFKKICDAIDYFQNSSPNWKNPFGDGKAAERIYQTFFKTKSQTLPPPQTLTSDLTVMGMGYMGLPICLLLAEAHHKVSGFDIDEERISKLQKGGLPFQERGLEPLFHQVAKNNPVNFTNELPSSSTYLICVPTPFTEKGCDLTFVLSALNLIVKVRKEHALIIIESTIQPGTGEALKEYLETEAPGRFLLAHCPERAIPGNTLHELSHNHRIVGGIDEESSKAAALIYKSFSKSDVHITNMKTAEIVKVFENTSRDVELALSNELENICREVGVDSREAIRLANLHPRVDILSPGIGVGGHCIPIDPYFLINTVKNNALISLARELNNQRPTEIAKRIANRATKQGHKKIGLLGVSYKANVDDTRETPVKEIIFELLELGFELSVCDPNVKDFDFGLSSLESTLERSDICFELVNHDCFKSLKSEKLVRFHELFEHSLSKVFDKDLRKTSSKLN